VIRLKLRKVESEFGLNVVLEDIDKYISFSFGGNGDLYWAIHSRNKDDKYFIITKENYNLYNLFLQLYDDIENINIFDLDYVPFYLETKEEKDEYIKKRKEEVEYQKYKCSTFNYLNYNELFAKEEKVITWYSDETAHKVANFVKIKKYESCFKIEFFIQSYIEGFDKDFHTDYYVPIRFRNSGSRYDPFNMLFMKMYNEMHLLDDINEIGHQIHIEEYLYGKEKCKKLIR